MHSTFLITQLNLIVIMVKNAKYALSKAVNFLWMNKFQEVKILLM